MTLISAAGGVYLNFSGFDDEVDELCDAVFGESQQRLAEVRATYDPDGADRGSSWSRVSFIAMTVRPTFQIGSCCSST